METRAWAERATTVSRPRPPPPVARRRYPSLSDDGQPYFAWRQRPRRRADVASSVERAAHANERPSFLSVRAIALLAILVILAVLMATAA